MLKCSWYFLQSLLGESMKVLLIEDSREILESIAMVFQMRWPESTILTTTLGEKGIQLAGTENPDIIILDLGLPDIDGFQVLRSVREFSDIPIIILTVREDEMNKIKGLELGADDYVVKPFSPGELLARVKAVTRRFNESNPTNISAPNPTIAGNFRIDLNSEEVTIDDKPIKLSPRAFSLLRQLVINKGKFVPTQVLTQAITFAGEEPDERMALFLVKSVSQQIGEGTGNPDIIVGDPKVGYKISIP